MKPRQRRYRLLADWKLQSGFCLRVSLYWLMCQVAMVGTVLGISFLGESFVAGGPQRLIVPAVLVSSLFLPIALFDLLKYTNRLAGPLRRLRHDMEQLAKQKEVAELRFRPSDLMQDLSENFNQIRSQLYRIEEGKDNFRNQSRCPEKPLPAAGGAE
ncbi:MAG: hypothetical protein P8J27_12750 [Mariniblastus sp.]|nr:hypothetical protein [Mariniblastus sp.]